MTSFYTRPPDLDGSSSDDELHSDALDAPVSSRSPAYADALNRFIKLGFTEEEARLLLKE